jgi:hypothetical protein
MKHLRQYKTGSEAASREAVKIRTLIADLGRIVQILNSDIAAEEEQTGVFDRSQLEYPLFATTLAVRRDHLRKTIAALEQRLATSRSAAWDADETLQRPVPYLN